MYNQIYSIIIQRNYHFIPFATPANLIKSKLILKNEEGYVLHVLYEIQLKNIKRLLFFFLIVIYTFQQIHFVIYRIQKEAGNWCTNTKTSKTYLFN